MKKKSKRSAIVLLIAIALIITGFNCLSKVVGQTKGEEGPRVIGKPVMVKAEQAAADDVTEWVEETETHPLKLTDEERALVEGIIASEARGESIECMMACAQAIRDRVLESGKSVTSVCTAKNQFAQPFKGKLSKGIKEKISDAVLFTFDMGVDTLEYPTRHFYAYNLIPAPGWTKNLEHRGDIDGVRFYE